MIIPPEVIGPGAAVGSQIGPVCVMRPISGFSDEDGEREVTEAPEEAAGASEEVLDSGANGEVLNSPAIDGDKEEEVKIGCVVATEAVVPSVEYRVSVPLSQVVLAMRVVEIEGAGPVELSQSQ